MSDAVRRNDTPTHAIDTSAQANETSRRSENSVVLVRSKWGASKDALHTASSRGLNAVSQWFGVRDDEEVRKWHSRTLVAKHTREVDTQKGDAEDLDNFQTVKGGIEPKNQPITREEKDGVAPRRSLRMFGSRQLHRLGSVRTTTSNSNGKDPPQRADGDDGVDDDLILRDKLTDAIVLPSDDEDDFESDLAAIETEMNRTVLTGPTRESHRLSALFMEDHEKEVSELGQHKLPKRYAFADWFSIEGTLRKDGTLYTQGKKSEPHTMCRSLVYPLPVRARPVQRTRQGAKLKDLDRNQQHKLDIQETFFPWFNIISISLMVILMCVELVVYGGVLPIGVGTTRVTSNVTVFGREEDYEVTVLHAQNMWIGPDTLTLLGLGAKFAPCMRRDPDVFIALDNQNQEYAAADPWACCVLSDGTCSMTPETECVISAYPGLLPVLMTGQTCDQVATCTVINRPCCISIYGQCNMVSESYCAALDGSWNDQIELCQDYDNCLDNVCQMGGLKNPEEPNQWWRYITPIFLHVGVLHLLFNCIFQLSVGIIIERSCGWFRFSLIFFISGIGGNLVSALFAPHIPQVGSSGALYGLLAVLMIELIQSWSILASPWKETAKLGITVIISLLIGTLPWIDNWAHLGGFVFGIPCAILFLPYITFGKWDRRRKLVLIAVSAPVLMIMLVVFFVLFYEGASDFCSFCKYFNCIPYTSSLCEDNGADWNGEYFNINFALP